METSRGKNKISKASEVQKAIETLADDELLEYLKDLDNTNPETGDPYVLFHGSKTRGIKILEPRKESTRDKNEGEVVFGTPSLPLVSMFLVESDDSWTNTGRISHDNDEYFYQVIGDKERFQNEDKGGSIYILLPEGFYCDLQKGMRKFEWASKQSKAIERELHIDSAYSFMKQLGVRVTYLNKKEFEELVQIEPSVRAERIDKVINGAENVR